MCLELCRFGRMKFFGREGLVRDALLGVRDGEPGGRVPLEPRGLGRAPEQARHGLVPRVLAPGHEAAVEQRTSKG